MDNEIRKLYKQQTGHDAWTVISADENDLPYYLEGISPGYIKWLEERASLIGEAKSASVPKDSLPVSGAVNDAVSRAN